MQLRRPPLTKRIPALPVICDVNLLLSLVTDHNSNVIG
jgi:hypothetical protein